MGGIAGGGGKSKMTFVPLDRQFIPWTEKDGSQIGAEQFEARLCGKKGWVDLLLNHRVIVLSEAGSGKSDELAEQVRALRADDKTSFMFSVQGVAHDGLPGVLSARDRAEYEAWQVSSKPAWFFIDSVDEAKLDGIRLETAFRKVADGLFGFEHRAYIILSSRFTDWQFKADLARFDAALAMPTPRELEPPPTEHAALPRGPS